MRVRCKIVKVNGKETDHGSDAWFTVGNEYVVIGFSFDGHFDPNFLLFSEPEKSAVFSEMRFFEIVDSKVSACWHLARSWNGAFLMEPKSFDKPHFWEDYHDGKDWAQILFRNTYAELLAEDRKEMKG